MRFSRRIYLAGLIALLAGFYLSVLPGVTSVRASENSRYFPETGHTVSGKFLDYWNNNGGLPVFGYPITEAGNETDSETGKVYLTQWFERNNFQLHPEFAGSKYEVELGLLSKRLNTNRQKNDPAFQPGETKAGYFYFPQTRHYVSQLFYLYWQNNGSLDRLGFPLSEEQSETDPATGKVFLTQWFERARFEYHPENPGIYNVELGLLGNEIKNSSPVGIVNLFYKSLNNKTFQQAYNYWDTTTQTLPTYNQWVQGYSNLASVTSRTGAYQISAGAGQAYAGVPSVINAINKDGTRQTFYGCYFTHKVNIGADQPWFISRGVIQEDNSGASVETLLQKGAASCNGGA